MLLIIGLGNPTAQYQRTRHNIGFDVIDALAERLGNPGFKSRFNSEYAEVRLAGQAALLMKPMTYMNRSGQAVVQAAGYYKLTPQQMLVVYDDTELPIGTLRMRPQGSAAGHNGLANIMDRMNEMQIPRLRFGIGKPQIDGQPIPKHNYVLGQWTAEQAEQVRPVIDAACDAIELWAGEGIETAMNRYNTRIQNTDDDKT